MDSELSLAFGLHRAGRFADAARLYHSILSREPDHADALHLFGVMHQQIGQPTRAIELIGRALSLRPDAAVFSANLAEALRSLGEFERAIEYCRSALRIKPDFPEALNTLGLALQATGRVVEAVDQFVEALRIRPEFAMVRNNLGIALRDLGRLDEAFNAFRAAVDLDPNLAEARANLGQALVASGEAEPGLEHCLAAVRLRPDLAAGHNNLGNAYRALERWPEAHAAFERAARLAPDLPKVHVNRGLAFQSDGRCAEAVSCFLRAIELEPDDAQLWQLLASAHVLAEDYAAAVPCLARLIELNPERAESHNELGWALHQEGRNGEAADAYRRALDIRPGLIDARLNLGSLHEILGEMAEAEACYRRALGDEPGDPVALANLGNLLRGRMPDRDREAMTASLGETDLADGPRGDLLFAMAQVLDAKGEYGEAADRLVEANRLSLRRRTQQGRRYDARDHSQFVDRLIESFTPECFERLAGMGDSAHRPIFVFGLPRSGTTLVEQVLAGHPLIHAAGELRLARETFEAMPALLGQPAGSIRPCLAILDEERVKKLARRYLDGVQALVSRDRRGPDPSSVVDKMPDNYLYLGLIAILFPGATLIHVRRDFRDVALSCWMTNFRSIRWADDFENLAGRIREYRRLDDHWRVVLPTSVHEVAYERLVDDFEGEARRLVSACGLDWEPACLDFHRTERPVRTASATQVRQPLYRKAVARWERYEPFLGDLFGRLPGDRSRPMGNRSQA